MKQISKLWIVIITSALFYATAAAEETSWSCPNEETARQAFSTDETKSWPNYQEGPGARVQKQHPQTALVAQAKFMEGNNTTGAICQYYNHVGVVSMFIALDLQQGQVESPAFWRMEYMESYPENDRPDRIMINVCMEMREGFEFPSVKCGFKVSK